MKPIHWWGLGLMALGALLQLAGIFYGAADSVRHSGTGLFALGMLVELIGVGMGDDTFKRRRKEGP